MKKLFFLSLVIFASVGSMFGSSAPKASAKISPAQDSDEIYVILDYTQPVKYIRASFQSSNWQEPRYLLTIKHSNDSNSKVFQIMELQHSTTEMFYKPKVFDIASCASRENVYKAGVLLILERAIAIAQKTAPKKDIYSSWDVSSDECRPLIVGDKVYKENFEKKKKALFKKKTLSDEEHYNLR